MTTLLRISIKLSTLNSSLDYRSKQWISGLILSKPITYQPVSIPNIGSLNQRRFRLGVSRETWSFLEMGRGKDGILMREEGWKRKRKRRVVVAKLNQGFGGGGGGRRRDNNARVWGNLALAIGLTYLSMTGQLGWLFDAIGWVLDAIVSLWLLAVVLPLVGLGTFLWWATQDMVQDSCPNCGNEFQIFKSTVNDSLQLCPYCSQPFSVVGNEFVSDPVKFSNRSTSSGQGFKNFSARSNKKEKNFSTAVVDVEAEVEDID